MDYEVIIVGGGPVGLALAIDLGQRGVQCLLIDQRPEPLFLPKMERCHNRTMEIFRRLGVADAVRAAGWPFDLSIDGYLVSTLQDEPLTHWPRPSAADLAERASRVKDGSAPAEPYQVISQYTLEPLLKSVAEETPGVTVRFGWTLESFEERDTDVVVRMRDLEGTELTLTATYLAGCDGASSTVRKGVGARLEGDANVGEQYQALFYAEDLYDRIPESARGEHYHVADDRWSFLIVQDDRKHFTLHSRVDHPDEMAPLFERIVGAPVAYRTLWVGPWTMRLMLADRYASKRVFLAGDAAHLVTPFAGLGMNTGIGDVSDLAWKLAGTLHGWGGPGLLASYEPERRAVGVRNVAAGRRAFEATQRWRTVLAESVRANVQNGLERVGEVVYEEHLRGAIDIDGIIRGYRYWSSPIIAGEPADDGADQDRYDYRPTTLPGARLPHLWWSDGTPLQDHVNAGYVLLACTRDAASEPGVSALRESFRALGCPFSVLDVSVLPAASQVYERVYVLVRPDLHVAWRGDVLPNDPDPLTRLVTGHG